MKSHQFLVGAMLFLSLGCTTQSNHSLTKITADYQKYGLSKTVKSVKVLSYSVIEKFGDYEKGELLDNENYILYFDESGNLSESSSFSKTGKLTFKTVYKYRDGISIGSINYSSNGEISTEIQTEYDGDILLSRTIIDPDAHELKKYGIDNPTNQKFDFSNDGKRITGFVRTDDGVKKEQYIYKWNGNTVDITSHDLNGTPTGHHRTEEYDDLNRQIKLIYENGITCEVKYNDKGLPVYLKNAHITKGTVIFDPYNKTEKISHLTYKYDKKGNWIERVEYDGEIKKPISISEQTIKY